MASTFHEGVTSRDDENNSRDIGVGNVELEAKIQEKPIRQISAKRQDVDLVDTLAKLGRLPSTHTLKILQ